MPADPAPPPPSLPGAPPPGPSVETVAAVGLGLALAGALVALYAPSLALLGSPLRTLVVLANVFVFLPFLLATAFARFAREATPDPQGTFFTLFAAVAVAAWSVLTVLRLVRF